MDNKVAENPFKNRTVSDRSVIGDEVKGKETSFIVISALFVTLYVVSNVMAVKVIGLWNLFYFDAGTITFPFAYMLGDVLTEDGFVGFVNTSSVYQGITTPLLNLQLGAKLGNDKVSSGSGIREKNFYGTELIGPVLVKNSHFLAHICKEITGEAVQLPKDSYAQKAYDVALAELTKRLQA